MIQIAPEELAFAGKLSSIRRGPSPSDGAQSRPRYHELAYRGGNKLTFRTTDHRISIVSELPVVGEDNPWECRVDRENFDTFAKHEGGGRFTLDPTPTRCVLVRKGMVVTPLGLESTPPHLKDEDAIDLPWLENTAELQVEGGTVATPPLNRPAVEEICTRYQYPFWKVPVDTPFPNILEVPHAQVGGTVLLNELRRSRHICAHGGAARVWLRSVNP